MKFAINWNKLPWCLNICNKLYILVWWRYIYFLKFVFLSSICFSFRFFVYGSRVKLISASRKQQPLDIDTDMRTRTWLICQKLKKKIHRIYSSSRRSTSVYCSTSSVRDSRKKYIGFQTNEYKKLCDSGVVSASFKFSFSFTI